MSSMPGASSLTITVKRTLDGYASGYLHQQVEAGSVLDVLPPAGTFTPGSLDGDFLLFAAGSGITPVMSILTSVLRSGRGRVVLVYANRDEQSVIFGAALRSLLAEYPGRLVLLHWLDALHGVPSAESVAALVRPYVSGYEPYICGPDAFLQVVRSALGGLGVAARTVRVERFLSLAENPFESSADASDGGVDATLTVSLDGDTKVLPWPAGTRMLDVLITAGLDAPFSCRQGVCGACACQLTGGKIDMAHNEVLEDADLADGYILACQAVALTPDVSIDY
jgi:3-ketosteroid 9alpha-monooxygenase subunit B